MAEIILGVIFALAGAVMFLLAFGFGLMASHPTGHAPGDDSPWRPVWICGIAGAASIALSMFLFFGG